MTSKQTISRESRGKRYWEKHLEALQRSGLSRAEYCRRQSLPYHALTYWQHKLGKAKCDSGQLVPVPMQLISSLGKPGPGCLP
ncbi:IS66 family insertion sequence element accessory protein TnpA, partial [Desulfogranum mediterraneum]|uniref:IS66 family insertion sequence element accessory protein TnpA n=2 Tax=Desulfogranum mediterraneum TaxID=160661 RepID=UPI002FC2C9A4